MEENRYDILIVGQGIAGTCIAFQFIKAGHSVMVIDPEKESSASLVASGIINPVTGRHFVKSFNYDKLWSYLEDFYPDFESFIKLPVFKNLSIFRGLSTVKDYNDWMMRSEDPDIVKVLTENNTISQFNDFYAIPEYYTSFKGGKVDTENMIKGFRKKLKSEGRFLGEEFCIEELQLKNDSVEYKNYTAKKIIFCEGYRAMSNPYFSYLPFNPFKGDIVVLNSEKRLPIDILKNDLFFVPIADHKVWIGTKNSYKLESEDPNSEYIELILKKSEALLKGVFSFDRAKAGIRPSVKDRRPLIGVHPLHPNIFIFNGLGSKGTSLAPYYSQRLFDFIVNGEILPIDVNIDRFNK